jgi:glucose/arabinose dehydrogenase
LHKSTLLWSLLGPCIAVSLVATVGYLSEGMASENNSNARLLLRDPGLTAELVAENLNYPTAMGFLGPNDILVLEKETGTVRRIIDGNIQNEPLLDLKLSGKGESGLVGIALDKNRRNQTGESARIFMYVSESKNNNTAQHYSFSPGNYVYRYEFTDGRLLNPKLLLSLPIGDENIHNGGEIVIGPDKNVYVTVGDIGRFESNTFPKTLNNEEGPEPDGTGGILRMSQEGRPVLENGNKILGSNYPLNLYYAYGIRNSFGIDFDPLTGKLWDSENGVESNDEVNLVEPGFNSGWKAIQGMSSFEKGFNSVQLVNFNGMGKYSDPEFVWYGSSVGPTALKFLTSDKLGDEYQNDLFVGDFNNGYIYHFELTEGRTELVLKGSLDSNTSKILESMGQSEVFAEGPGGVIDIQVGPDGYLYVLTLLLKGTDCDPDEPGCVTKNDSKIEGVIFRIVPTTTKLAS